MRVLWTSAKEVGFVPIVAPHCIENRGNDDLVFLEMSAAPEFLDVSSTNGSATSQNSSSRTAQSLTDREINGPPDDKTPALMRESLG